ncbi:SIR2 family protein [Celeribacter halophilus]|uniref:SIR2 family protein n=1 Tax=Celeribacter halophilus TaxID=576117 RepID=UPI003A8DDE18
MDYQQALASAINGNAILFFGAGFSRGLSSVTGEKIPSSHGLAKIFCKAGGIKENGDLRVAAKRFLKENSSEDLIKILRDYFIVNEMPESYDNIFKIPWRQVYTTNYDNTFEVGAQKHSIVYESVDATNIPRHTAGKKRVVHINGYINTVNKSNLNTSFKMTNSSYLTQHFRESPWSEVFKRDINSAHAVFFVGYSLYDIDIQEILFEDSDLKNKTFFIEREDITDDEIEELDLDSFGSIIKKGIVNFSKDIGGIDKELKNEDELIITSFSQPKYYNKNTVIQDKHVFELLLNGALDSELLYNDFISKDYKYCIMREQFSNALSEIENKENLLIHSGLANGKTVFAKQLSINLYNNGYSVFELNDDYLESYAISEINKILENHKKVLFLIENYTSNINVIKHIDDNRREETKLILIARSYEHERVENEIYFLRKIIDVRETSEIQLDKLSDSDLKSITNYFDLYGLWHKMYGNSSADKERYLKSAANREFHGILLGLLDSPQVKIKLNMFFNEMKNSDLLLMNIIAILCLSMSNLSNPNFHMVSALTNSNEIFDVSFRTHQVFQQLVSKNNDIALAKSSVLAEFLLTHFPNPVLLVDTLIKIAKNARTKGEGNKIYFSFYKDLASFRYIQKMVPKKGKRESLILFYQGLKEIPQERNNPHFWLQYAIARLSYPDEDNLLHAKHYLDTALSLASKRRNYWTDDIETQLARYYFESSIANSLNDAKIGFYNFEEGAKLIIKIYRNYNRPRKELFRPLKLVDNFYFKFKKDFTEHDINIINDYCELLNSFIIKEDMKHSRDIRSKLAGEAIRRVLSDIKVSKHISENS